VENEKNVLQETPLQGEPVSENENNQAIGIDDVFLNENDNALINDNQTHHEGEAGEEVQGEHIQEEQSEVVPQDWEASAKYFQSEKDKQFEENKALKQDLERFKALGEFVDGRPDVQEYLNGVLQGQQPSVEGQGSEQPSQPAVTVPEDFDPWDAYNDPNSPSYKYRSSQEQANIGKAMNEFKTDLSGKWEQEKKMQRFDKELENLGLDDTQKNQFYEFANTPVAQMSTEQLVAMWKASSPGTTPTQPDSPSMNAVRRTQNTPAQGTGVLQGEAPQQVKSDDDSMWDGIMDAAKKTTFN
tara:strand:- start:2630 stop:3526 length:897 start_codon:yes stop_codon:yes gene_type:complete